MEPSKETNMASSLLLPAFLLISSAVASPHGICKQQTSDPLLTAPAPTSTDSATCSSVVRPEAAYSPWSYTVVTTTRYATPLPSPVQLTTTFAPRFSDASTLLPANATYTSYSLNRNATALQDGEYGQGAYARLWASVSYNHSVPFTTTASPTPVASSELVFPPPLYSACPESADSCIDCYKLPEDFIWGVSSSAFQIEGGLTEDGRGPAALDIIGAVGYVGRDPGEVDAEVGDPGHRRRQLEPLTTGVERDGGQDGEHQDDQADAEGQLPREQLAALVGTPLAEIEREFIEATIDQCDGSIPRAARVLEVSPSTLYRKLETWSGLARRAIATMSQPSCASKCSSAARPTSPNAPAISTVPFASCAINPP